MYDSNTSAAGLQVADYMEEMQEDSEENYNKHFSQYMAAEVEGGDLEELMAKVMLHLLRLLTCYTMSMQGPLCILPGKGLACYIQFFELCMHNMPHTLQGRAADTTCA